MIAGKLGRSDRGLWAQVGAALVVAIALLLPSLFGPQLVGAGYTEDSTAPDTQIDSGPSGTTADNDPAFTYSAIPVADGASFECRLDAAAFATCPATGKSFTDVPLGTHVFEVRAVDAVGNADPSPATRSFTITIASPPPDGSPPETILMKKPRKRITLESGKVRVKFRFKGLDDATPADQLTFVCKLDRKRFRDCESPLRKRVGAGRHRFKVLAVDRAGNKDPTPAKFRFRVVVVGGAEA